MKIMRTWMMAAAMAVGALGFGAATAHAAHIGIYIGGPAAYVPPCPGPGYQWTAGYWDDDDWVPGQWVFVGGGPAYYGGTAYYGGPAYYGGYYGREWHGDDDHRGWGGDRGGWGGEHFRGGDRGGWGGDHARGGDHGWGRGRR